MNITVEKSWGMLDFVGRPTLVINLRNHVPKYCKDMLVVKYTFSKTLLLSEPFYLVCGIFGTFLAGILFGRMNLDFE